MHIHLKSLFQKLQAFYTMKEEYKNIGFLFYLTIRNKEELSRKRGVQCVGLQRNLSVVLYIKFSSISFKLQIFLGVQSGSLNI